MDLTENQKAWLSAIYDEAISDHRAEAVIERTRADCTTDEASKNTYIAKAQEHDQFADWLEEQKDNAEATL